MQMRSTEPGLVGIGEAVKNFKNNREQIRKSREEVDVLLNGNESTKPRVVGIGEAVKNFKNNREQIRNFREKVDVLLNGDESTTETKKEKEVNLYDVLGSGYISIKNKIGNLDFLEYRLIGDNLERNIGGLYMNLKDKVKKEKFQIETKDENGKTTLYYNDSLGCDNAIILLNNKSKDNLILEEGIEIIKSGILDIFKDLGINFKEEKDGNDISYISI